MFVLLATAAHAETLWLDPEAKPGPIELEVGDELVVPLDAGLDLAEWSVVVEGDQVPLDLLAFADGETLVVAAKGEDHLEATVEWTPKEGKASPGSTAQASLDWVLEETFIDNRHQG
jgi:hypothetical protein